MARHVDLGRAHSMSARSPGTGHCKECCLIISHLIRRRTSRYRGTMLDFNLCAHAASFYKRVWATDVTTASNPFLSAVTYPGILAIRRQCPWEFVDNDHDLLICRLFTGWKRTRTLAHTLYGVFPHGLPQCAVHAAFPTALSLAMHVA